MTLCRSKSFDSLFRNSECSKGLRLIPFWQQCQQKQPREFQCRDAHNVFYLHKVLKHMRVNLHPRTETELWAGSSTGVRNPLPTSALQMLQQPHMCVPIWLCRVGLMEPHCQGFTHHNLLPTSPPPFSLWKCLSTWLNPQGLELSVQEQCKQFACCALPLHSTMIPFSSSMGSFCHQKRNTCYALNRELQCIIMQNQ